MSDEINKESEGLMDTLKDKVMDTLGLDALSNKVEDMVDVAKEKIGGIFGQKGEDTLDTIIEKVEDKIEDATGQKVDLNGEESK